MSYKSVRPVAACAIALLPALGVQARGDVPLRQRSAPPCASAGAIAWFGPDAPADRRRLAAWCASVGPPAVSVPAYPEPPVDLLEEGLVVVTWNVHEGGGDIDRVVTDLRHRIYERSGRRPPVVILVQEAVRRSDEVPATFAAAVKPPARIRPSPAADDIIAAAERLGLWLAYVPSMRNGSDREDRGSAILSSLPLSEVAGIELPWASQRRVAVMAIATAMRDGRPRPLRVVSVHLDNRRSRWRQASALAALIGASRSDGLPIVVGGDLNTWFGTSEEAVRRLDAVVPRVRDCGDRPTFRFGRHLDHLFTTLLSEGRHGCDTADDFYGSDHRPTILRLFGVAHHCTPD